MSLQIIGASVLYVLPGDIFFPVFWKLSSNEPLLNEIFALELIFGAGVKRSGFHELAYFVILIGLSIFVNQINKIIRTLFPRSGDKLQQTSLVSCIQPLGLAGEVLMDGFSFLCLSMWEHPPAPWTSLWVSWMCGEVNAEDWPSIKEGEELADKHPHGLLSAVLDVVSQKVLVKLGPPSIAVP